MKHWSNSGMFHFQYCSLIFLKQIEYETKISHQYFIFYIAPKIHKKYEKKSFTFHVVPQSLNTRGFPIHFTIFPHKIFRSSISLRWKLFWLFHHKNIANPSRRSMHDDLRSLVCMMANIKLHSLLLRTL